MKKRIFTLIITFVLLLTVTACGGMMSGSKPNGESVDGGGAFNKTYGLEPSPLPGSYESGAVGDWDGYFSGYDNSIRSGQLTAKAWVDGENYSAWLKLIASSDQKDQMTSLYNDFIKRTGLLYSKNMLRVVVRCGDKPVENVTVQLANNNSSDKAFKAVTDAFGVAYLFLADDIDLAPTINLIYDGMIYEYQVHQLEENNTCYVQLDTITVKEKIQKLDLCLVVDTTGSMGDELEYLKVELRNVLENVDNDIHYDINLALIFYRDDGDEYVTRVFDFTSDLAMQYFNLGQQSAVGGGDFEESVEVALNKANQLQWRNDSIKILIDVLDAPLHKTNERYTNFANEAITFAARGIRVIPVICSGADNVLEFTMRSLALYTGGTYVYLTDHSGIGNSHEEPSIDDQDDNVEYLNRMLYRLIKQYCLGVKISPKDYTIEADEPCQEIEHRVKFISNTDTEYNDQIVKDGELLSRPADPVRDDYTFIGWGYLDKGEIIIFDFNTPIVQDLELTAFYQHNPE